MKLEKPCAVCGGKTTAYCFISIDNRPKRLSPVCHIHDDAASEDTNPKFKVVLYQETYTTVEVSAENEAEARAKVLRGDYDIDRDVFDTTVKESEIMSAERI